MPRGARTIHKKLFGQPKAKSTPSGSRCQIEERDDLMACRYYYLAKIHGYNYKDCLDQLSKEHFLSQVQTADRIKGRYDFLSDLIKEKPTLSYFKNKYPWLVWSAPKN